jgi:8-oxo-dGTP diphosphatase
MKKPHEEQHLQFAVLAVDVLIFTIRDGKILIRLSNVDRPPFFNNVPGFPGGLIRPEETAEETVNRILVEKALISSNDTYIEQFYTFSKVDRDPRGRVVSVGYIAFIPWEKLSDEERLGDANVWWSEKRNIKNLAYDHTHMLSKAMEYIHTRIKSTTIIFKLLPDRFTLTMVESSLEIILEEKLDKRNFRKKIAKTKILKTLKEKTTGMKHRPAQLYSVKSNDVIEASLF